MHSLQLLSSVSHKPTDNVINSMVACLRLFLVVMLVLLQFAAPLVHAHVNDFGPARGLHLHEFETLHIKSDPLVTAVVDSASSVQSSIVELGAAIKVQQPGEDVASIGWLSGGPLSLPERYLVDTINFSPHDPGKLSKPFLGQNPTRAPPA